MATLVLSTVGNALGGPVGGAIGALIGQSIDQQLLGPSTKGPRLSDLHVQTSSYGTQIPRIYGTMRVAGTVIWATDLVESTETSGAKGQPDTTYSYSVSFAVALSSRQVVSIKRIWADGNLLRGEAGDFKVSTIFRFYDGSEDQIVDPLIGSIEGIANTPAYRGLALAVFENLELANFGNRIPFLTFEVMADEDPPTIATVLADCSRGLVVMGATQTIGGYAAYGQTSAAALQPLIDAYALALFDDGTALRSPSGTAARSIDGGDFGNSADNQKAPHMQREQTPARSLPSTLRLRYYDPALDYQTGESRASAGEQPASEEQLELPATLGAGDAKGLAQQIIAREWARRDKLTLALPPKYLDLQPGSEVAVDLSPGSWRVEQCTIDGFVIRAVLRPSWQATPAIAAEAGRIVANADVVAGPLTVALLDIPDVLQQSSSQPTILLAASAPTAGWKRSPVEVSYGGQMIAVQTADRKAVLGRALGALAEAGPWLIDMQSSVDVQLIDAQQWLVSCDDDALIAGTNLALIGNELVQFGSAVAIGEGQFRLSRLLRGRAGSEWASSGHVAGDLFCLIEASALRSLVLPAWTVGARVSATARDGAAASITISGESLRPPSPVDLACVLLPTGELAVSWTRRSRAGWAWVDEIDAPLGETSEQYRVTLTGPENTLEYLASTPSLTVSSADVTALGSGSVDVEVRQLGDQAASRPAQLTFSIS